MAELANLGWLLLLLLLANAATVLITVKAIPKTEPTKEILVADDDDNDDSRLQPSSGSAKILPLSNEILISVDLFP